MTVMMTFHENGTAACLYHELIDLSELGRLACERASMIEFDEVTQKWQVTRPESDTVLFSHSSRDTCLQWESEHALVLGVRD